MTETMASMSIIKKDKHVITFERINQSCRIGRFRLDILYPAFLAENGLEFRRVSGNQSEVESSFRKLFDNRLSKKTRPSDNSNSFIRWH
jgi:hypothetical protein